MPVTYELDTEVTEARLTDLLNFIYTKWILPNQRFFLNAQITTVEGEHVLTFTVLGPTREWSIHVEIVGRRPIIVRMSPSDEALPLTYLERLKNDIMLNIQVFEENVRKTTLHFSWIEGEEVIPEKIVTRQRGAFNKLFFDSMLPLFMLFMLASMFIFYSFGTFAPLFLVAFQFVLVIFSPKIVARMGEWTITERNPSVHLLKYELQMSEYKEFRKKIDRQRLVQMKNEIYQRTIASKGDLDCLTAQEIFNRYGLDCKQENLSSKKVNVYELVKKGAELYNVKVPQIVVSNSMIPNAAASGPSPNYGTVLLTTGLLAQLEEDEIFSILGHEFAHLKGRDPLILFGLQISEYLFRVYVFFPFLYSLPISYYTLFTAFYYLYLPLALGLVYFIGKFFEARADLESAIKVGQPKALAEGLRKIGFRKLQYEEKIPAYRVQSWLSWDPHPPIYYRISRLEKMETPIKVGNTLIQSIKDVLGGFFEALGLR
ncbi:M48 family metalloprotease [Candidatus Bathyarchaeota archaeon]|nr:M48 family metalloprotease [Candidatus Bathyarchaeota archaeon]